MAKSSIDKTFVVNDKKSIDEFAKAIKEAEDNEKEQKVLKLIIEKEIDIWLLMNCDYDSYCHIRTKALETNMQLLDDMNKREGVSLPTMVEFNFIKEAVEKYGKVKKKIKDLTIEEVSEICIRNSHCSTCSLWINHHCIYQVSSLFSKEELNKEIEV